MVLLIKEDMALVVGVAKVALVEEEANMEVTEALVVRLVVKAVAVEVRAVNRVVTKDPVDIVIKVNLVMDRVANLEVAEEVNKGVSQI